MSKVGIHWMRSTNCMPRLAASNRHQRNRASTSSSAVAAKARLRRSDRFRVTASRRMVAKGTAIRTLMRWVANSSVMLAPVNHQVEEREEPGKTTDDEQQMFLQGVQLPRLQESP